MNTIFIITQVKENQRNKHLADTHNNTEQN